MLGQFIDVFQPATALLLIHNSTAPSTHPHQTHQSTASMHELEAFTENTAMPVGQLGDAHRWVWVVWSTVKVVLAVLVCAGITIRAEQGFGQSLHCVSPALQLCVSICIQACSSAAAEATHLALTALTAAGATRLQC